MKVRQLILDSLRLQLELFRLPVLRKTLYCESGVFACEVAGTGVVQIQGSRGRVYDGCGCGSQVDRRLVLSRPAGLEGCVE